LPQSRKRKRRRHSQSASQKRKKSGGTQKTLVILLIAGIFIAGILFAFSRESDRPPPPSDEVTSSSGLKYVDEVVGTGASPRPGATVTVHYTGTLTDGTKFDSSVDRNEPLTFKIGVGKVIQGWDEGVMTMKVGGKRKLIVPPELGYGASGKGKIPPNSTLLFDVELLDVN
jgi:peptidylprolyl isomerase